MKVVVILFRIALFPMFLLGWIIWYVGLYNDWESYGYSFTDGIKDWINGK